jgi:cell division protein FtsZ
VDTLIVIPNEKLFSISDQNTKVTDAFKLADSVLYEGVRSIIDLILRPGLINLDFADVTTVMKSSGRAYIGTGKCEDEKITSLSRGKIAVEKALNNPLLDVDSIEEATNVLIHITAGADLTLEDVRIV